MSAAREPNPLRPYYTPPSIGQHTSAPPNLSSMPNDTTNHASTSASSNSYGSSTRNILSDLDYSNYLSDPSYNASEVLKGLVEQMVWKYSSVFLAQPFEVAKMVLQVHPAADRQKKIAKDPFVEDERRSTGSFRSRSFDLNSSSDSDPDFPSYFSSSAPLSHTATRNPRGRRRRTTPSPDGVPRVHPPQSPPRKATSPHKLDFTSSSSVLSALSSLWNTEGAWGIWKGTNCTFVHSVLLSTITNFTRSFLSALFALPDPGFSFTLTPWGPGTYTGGLDVLNSPSPMSSLLVAVSAAGIAGTILAPLDMVRTKLILTPCTHPPRSIISTLKSLPSWTLPWSLAPTTLLHSTLPTFISASTPLILRSNLGIDPVLTPSLYSIATLCSQVVELGIKIPLETVLRRGQIAIARSIPNAKPIDTVVELGAYRGLFGTMRTIVYEEGEREAATAPEHPKMGKGIGSAKINKAGQQRQRGQGPEGLYRGLRVGLWGLLGVWGAATLGGVGAKGGEF